MSSVQNPLTLIVPIRPDGGADALKLILTGNALLPVSIHSRLDQLKMVHFARFVFLNNDTQFGIITSYDGDLDAYLIDILDLFSEMFDAMMPQFVGGPPTPVQQHQPEFLAWVNAHDTPCFGGLYSAYPTLTVPDILATCGVPLATEEGSGIVSDVVAEVVSVVSDVVSAVKDIFSPHATGPAPLPLSDIQGLIFRGYGLSAVRYFVLRVDHVAEANAFLASLVSDEPGGGLRITSAAPWSTKPRACLNVGFTSSGLTALGVSKADLATFSPSFINGSAAQSRSNPSLGDTGTSGPDFWVGHLGDSEVHVLLMLFAASNGVLAEASEVLRRGFASGLTELSHQDGHTFPDDVVHFGYRDNISQPAIQGGPSKGATSVENSVPPGELLLGYPSQFNGFSYPVPTPAALGLNGTFAAYRILEQDVAGFDAFLHEGGRQLGVSDEKMAALVCGRWRNGVPLAVSPDTDQPSRALTAAEQNDFTYADDPMGFRCPRGAHARRSNPRQSQLVGGGAGDNRRMVRRGIPYGPPYDPAAPADRIPRGLLGLFLCVSLEDQFEFVMSQWLNTDAFGLQGDKDPMLGDATALTSRFQTQAPGTYPGEVASRRVTGFNRFVHTKGSAYVFLPSLTALRTVLASPL